MLVNAIAGINEASQNVKVTAAREGLTMIAAFVKERFYNIELETYYG